MRIAEFLSSKKLFSACVKLARLPEETVAEYKGDNVDAGEGELTLHEALTISTDDPRLQAMRIGSHVKIEPILPGREKKKKLISCRKCKMQFQTAQEKDKHYRRFPSECVQTQTTFKCNLCQSEFSTRLQRHRHILDSHAEKPASSSENQKVEIFILINKL